MYYLLLYDGACSLCTSFARQVKAWDRRDRLQTLAFDDPQAREWEARIGPGFRQSFHLVHPDGRIEHGDRAIPTVVGLLPWGALPAWGMRYLPGSRKLIERAYVWVASRRTCGVQKNI